MWFVFHSDLVEGPTVIAWGLGHPRGSLHYVMCLQWCSCLLESFLLLDAKQNAVLLWQVRLSVHLPDVQESR